MSEIYTGNRDTEITGPVVETVGLVLDSGENMSPQGFADQESGPPSMQSDNMPQIDIQVSETVVAAPEAEPGAISPEDIERFEQQGFCRQAPKFSDQINDETRVNKITCVIRGIASSLHVTTSAYSAKASSLDTMTEYEAVNDLSNFLKTVIADEHIDQGHKLKAQDILDGATWIGEKEYTEAAAGIAALWKKQLADDSNLILFPIVGQIAKRSGIKQAKSDEWLLDNIFSNFTDEELVQFKGRIIFGSDRIPPELPASDLKVILLDDWAISGIQLEDVYNIVADSLPEYIDSLEIQLITASETRIENGLERINATGLSSKKVPVSAYFKANNAPLAGHDSARVTGFHSSVDFDFEMDIAIMVRYLRFNAKPNDEPIYMPPGTNIMRPYRKSGFKLEQTARAKRVLRS